MENGGESARGLHAIRVLENKKDFTLDSLIAAAYDSYLTWFEKPLPALIKAGTRRPARNPLKAKLADADRRSCASGITAGRWIRCPLRWRSSGAKMCGAARAVADGARRRADDCDRRMRRPSTLLQSLAAASRQTRRPTSEAGRRPGATSIASSASPATSSSPSTTPARAFLSASPSAVWGSLASFGARAYPGTKKWYGTSGNSFVAVVEFGDNGARQGGHRRRRERRSRSPHFNDQAKRYSTGDLREVYFYRDSSRDTPSASTIPETENPFRDQGRKSRQKIGQGDRWTYFVVGPENQGLA